MSTIKPFAEFSIEVPQSPIIRKAGHLLRFLLLATIIVALISDIIYPIWLFVFAKNSADTLKPYAEAFEVDKNRIDADVGLLCIIIWLGIAIYSVVRAIYGIHGLICCNPQSLTTFLLLTGLHLIIALPKIDFIRSIALNGIAAVVAYGLLCSLAMQKDKEAKKKTIEVKKETETCTEVVSAL